nr:CHAT domain-containing tetratricopeptide repeat protein [Plastoroseomonas arctica]
MQAQLPAIELAALEVHSPASAAAAERRARAALAVFRAAPLLDRRPEALATVVLGRAAESRGQVDVAAGLYRRAQGIFEATRGPLTPDLGFSLVRLGRMLTRAGRYTEAAPPLDRSIALYERVGSAGTVRLVEALTARAELRALSGDRRGALDQIRHAQALLSDRVASGEAMSGAGEAQQRNARALFAAQAMLLHSLADLDPRAMEDAFAASQSSLISRAGEALRRSSLRLMAGSGAEAALLRTLVETTEGLRQTDALVLGAAARPEGAAELRSLQALRADQLEQLRAAAATLREANPTLAEFLRPRPVRLDAVRQALAADEAVLAPLIADDRTLVWVVTRERAIAVPAAIDRDGLAALVDRVRASLDLGRPDGPPAFARDAAEALYRALIAPVEATGVLAGISHMMLVPDGALQRLPPHLLAMPGAGWLMDRYATVILPSLAAITAVRGAARQASTAPRALLGVGDPMLSRYAAGSGGNRGIPPSVRDGLSALSALPETASELHALAGLFGAEESTLLLGQDATERRVAEARPELFRTLAFATHAVMAGELPGLVEPAIILTPNNEDVPFEGLLTASDVAAIRLDADLVLLSACNTAAAEGGPYAEGLSGLARAFLQSGARRLLVSHWAVNSQAAVVLTTAFVAAQLREPSARPAAHLRDAMQTLMRAGGGIAGHPAYWAPFVIVGG